ncbi:MAG: choice-of-anchor Q domain-containing protein, partial [Gemmataceae bacterium]
LTGNVFANNGGTIFNNGTVVSGGGNVADTFPLQLNPATDRLNANPLLGPLRDNGGPVPTFALLPGSPALDFAGPSAPAVDARGIARPGGAADSGAFEARAFSFVTTGDGQVTTVGQDFAAPLTVRVTEGDNPLPGVSFTFTASGATFGGAGSGTVVTDDSGSASSGTVTAGTRAGFIPASASTAGNEVDYFLFADAGEVAAYVLDPVDAQGDPITDVDPGTPFGLRITAEDIYGNRVFDELPDLAFTSSDPGAVLPPPQSPDAEVPIVFGFVLRQPGLQSLTATEVGGRSPLSATVTLTVNNAPPADVTVSPAASDIRQGETVNLVVTFADPGDGRDHRVQVRWGDGAIDTFTVAAGEFSFPASHTYTSLPGRGEGEEEGEGGTAFFILVTVSDEDELSGFGFGTAFVTNVPPTVNAGENEFVNVGDRFRRALRATDPGGPPFVVVDFGDGGEPAVVEPDEGGSYPLDHLYEAEGSYLVTVTAYDGDGGMTESTFYVHMLLDGINTDRAVEIVLGGTADRTASITVPNVTATFFREGRVGEDSALTVVPVPFRVADGVDGEPYEPVVIDGEPTAIVAAFDVRGVNIGPNDTATVVFTYFNDDFDLPSLFYFDGVETVEIGRDQYRVDAAARTITIRFSGASDPKLSDLTLTVFTITVPIGVVSPVQPTPTPGLGGGGGAGGVFPLVLPTAVRSPFEGTADEGRVAQAAAYDGPGTVVGRAAAALMVTTAGLAGEPEEEDGGDVPTWFTRRTRGVGALADLPPPPDAAAALPGVTLTPAEPRSLDFGPSSDRPVEEVEPPEAEAQEMAAPEEADGQASAPSPFLLPLAGLLFARPPRRRR